VVKPPGDDRTDDRTDDRALLRDALRALRRRADLDVAFGGLVEPGGTTRLDVFLGTRTHALDNLHVAHNAGLGGHALAVRRAVVVNDYLTSPLISHHYDRQVAAEGLGAMFAVPVSNGRTSCMVLYGAARGDGRFGDRVLDSVVRVVASVSRQAAIRAEVDRQISALSGQLRSAGLDRPDSARWDIVRSAYAELRVVAQAVDDPALRAKLAGVLDRLASASAGSAETSAVPRLSSREIDVLSCISIGCTNAETGQRLQILPETVKSYLASAMRKLDVHDRHAATTAARRLGLLP